VNMSAGAFGLVCGVCRSIDRWLGVALSRVAYLLACLLASSCLRTYLFHLLRCPTHTHTHTHTHTRPRRTIDAYMYMYTHAHIDIPHAMCVLHAPVTRHLGSVRFVYGCMWEALRPATDVRHLLPVCLACAGPPCCCV